MKPQEASSVRRSSAAAGAMPLALVEQVRDVMDTNADKRLRPVGRVGAAIAFVVLSVWVTRNAWRDVWLMSLADPESSHVLLVPLVFAWLAWNDRRGLTKRVCGNRSGVWAGFSTRSCSATSMARSSCVSTSRT